MSHDNQYLVHKQESKRRFKHSLENVLCSLKGSRKRQKTTILGRIKALSFQNPKSARVRMSGFVRIYRFQCCSTSWLLSILKKSETSIPQIKQNCHSPPNSILAHLPVPDGSLIFVPCSRFKAMNLTPLVLVFCNPGLPIGSSISPQFWVSCD